MEFSESLKKNEEFRKVYNLGKSYANKYLIMYILKKEVKEEKPLKNRIGISVSKKVGNSVVRHHLTRLIRESYRLNESGFQRGYDLVVIARATAKKCSYREIESALLHLAHMHRILKNEKDTHMAH